MTQLILNAPGDSITTSTGATTTANGFAQSIAAAKQYSLNMLAVSGNEAGDQAAAVYGLTPSAGFRSIYMIGVNNFRHFNLCAVNAEAYRSTVFAEAAWMAILNSDLIKGSAATYTGSGWNVAAAWGSLGKYSDTLNDYYEYSIPAGSSVIYVATTQQDTSTGEETVYLNGVSQGSYLVAPAAANVTALGIAYMPKLYRIDGVDPGSSHTIRIQKSNASAAGSRIYSGWCWGNGMKTQCQYPKLVLGTPTPFTAAGYIADGGSLEATNAYRAIMLGVGAQLKADGLDVAVADAYSVINTSIDISSDGAHPNDEGHARIANCFLAVMT